MRIVRKETGGVPFYACDGFDGIPHGFSTRLGGVSKPPMDTMNLAANRGDDPASVRENFRRFCAAVGTDVNALVKNHQVHGDVIRSVTSADIMSTPEAPGLFEADGLVTDEQGVCLTIFSSDCVPVLLYDPVRRVAAGVHAGWRGTALGAAARAAEAMAERYGCDPADLRAAIGPAIGACCFQTRADVPDALRAHMGGDAQQFIFPQSEPETFRVDLKGANVRWLIRAGVKREHIAVSDACTFCMRDEFWSHRRQGEGRGSMAAVIQIGVRG